MAVIYDNTTKVARMTATRDQVTSGTLVIQTAANAVLAAAETADDAAAAFATAAVEAFLAGVETGTDTLAAMVFTVPISAGRFAFPGESASGGAVFQSGNGGRVASRSNGGTIIQSGNGGKVLRG